MEYYIIIPQNQNRTLINEILVQFTYLVGMIADQNFYDICFTFFILRLRLRSTAEGRSFSGPNIRQRLKVKIGPTVQHTDYYILINLIFKLIIILTIYVCTSNWARWFSSLLGVFWILYGLDYKIFTVHTKIIDYCTTNGLVQRESTKNI